MVRRLWLIPTIFALHLSPATLGQTRSTLTITREDLTPVFRDQKALDALARYTQGDYRGAFEKLMAVAYGRQKPEHLERLRYLLALSALKIGEFDTALRALEGLEDFAPVVKDHILLLRGRALGALGRCKEAISVFETITPNSVPWADSRVFLGDCLMADGRAEEAASAYQAAIDSGKRYPEVVGKLASALSATGKGDEAISLLRRFYFRSLGPEKSAFLKVLSAFGVALEPTEAERLDQAEALLTIHASKDAIETAKPLLKSRDPSIRCRAGYVQAKAMAKLRRHSEAFSAFERLASECEGHLDLALVLFNAVRSAIRSGRDEDAWRLAEVLKKRFPSSTLNDDVATWFARAAIKAKDTKKAEKILKESLKAWPDGDMALESMWLLAWAAIEAQAYKKALAYLKKGREAATSRNDYDFASRFAYWEARVLGLLHQKKEAKAAYEACVRDYPMTFYAFLALSRLSSEKEALAVLTRLKKEPPLGRFLTLSKAVNVQEGPIGRALWFAKTGLLLEATRELSASEAPTPEEAFLRALLLEVAHDERKAHKLAHKALKKIGGFWPDTSTSDYYRLAYPRPFRDIVEKVAKEAHIDPFLIWAVMREESAFNPEIESHANAIGLMQLILPTAQAMAKKFGLKVSEETLRQPQVNVRLGAAYLAKLLQKFKEPLFAIAGYNAGEGAVSRWLKERPKAPLDVFVEAISAEETRNYTRRVFESYAAYRFLYGQDKERVLLLRF